MSVEAITWAVKQDIKPSSAKFILVMLANCADAVGGRCYPSIPYLCDATSQDRKTVMENLKRLVLAGYIRDTGERKGSTKSVVVYVLQNPVSVAPAGGQDCANVGESSAENGTAKQAQKRDGLRGEAVPFFPISSTVFPYKQSRFSREAVPKTVLGTVKEPSIEPSRNKSTARGSFKPDDVCDSVWADFETLRKAKKAPITRTVIDGIEREAGIAGMTIGQAILMCVERNWASFKADWLHRETPQNRFAGGAGVRESAAERGARLERKRWEDLTGERHPDNVAEHGGVHGGDVIDVGAGVTVFGGVQ